MSVTAIKKGKRNGSAGVIKFDGKRKNNSAAIAPKIRENIRSRFNKER
jgi:hypothetical protein